MPPLSPTEKEVVLPSRGAVITGTSGTGTGTGASGGEVGSGDSSRNDELLPGEENEVGGSGCNDAWQRATAPASSAAADFELLMFVRGEGTGEWDYPWDLTGGLYR